MSIKLIYKIFLLKNTRFHPLVRITITVSNSLTRYRTIVFFNEGKNLSGYHLMVYYVPRRIMRVITRRATMLTGERSRDVAEAKPRRSRGAINPASILNESRNYPNCVHWHIFYFMWLRRVYEFLCVHSNLIYYSSWFSSIALDISRLVPAILIFSILCSSSIL